MRAVLVVAWFLDASRVGGKRMLPIYGYLLSPETLAAAVSQFPRENTHNSMAWVGHTARGT